MDKGASPSVVSLLMRSVGGRRYELDGAVRAESSGNCAAAELGRAEASCSWFLPAVTCVWTLTLKCATDGPPPLNGFSRIGNIVFKDA